MKYLSRLKYYHSNRDKNSKDIWKTAFIKAEMKNT